VGCLEALTEGGTRWLTIERVDVLVHDQRDRSRSRYELAEPVEPTGADMNTRRRKDRSVQISRTPVRALVQGAALLEEEPELVRISGEWAPALRNAFPRLGRRRLQMEGECAFD